MKIPIVIAVILILSAPVAYRDPYMTVPESIEVRAGETARIEVVLEHVQTTMWNVKVYVDLDQIESRFLQRLEITADKENPIYFDEEIPHGTEISAVIEVKVAANSPSGEVRIPIVATGSKGPCMKGCEPFFLQKSTNLIIRRQDPKLALMVSEAAFEVYPGEAVQVKVQLKNYGAATAYVEQLEAVPDESLQLQMQTVPSTVSSGTTESVVITIFTKDVAPGNYLIHLKLIYKDTIQNVYTDSKTVYITILENEESPSPTVPPTSQPSPIPPENSDSSEKYQYFLVGMFTGASTFGAAVMVGIFLKKRRPAK